MPSFDITNKLEMQMLDNGLNTARKELQTRYDLKDSGSLIEFDSKAKTIKVTSDTDMHADAVSDIILSRCIKQQVDPKSFDLSQKPYPSGKTVIKNIPIKEGIDKETAKKIIKAIKDSGIKVQASIMDDIIRVTGKKIDDLQAVISLCRNGDFGIPLQYVNMKS